MDWDAGVPKGKSKPWVGKGSSKPFDKTITEENLELTEKQINALLSSPNTLNDLYDDWSSDEYLNSYFDVAELLKITADKLMCV